MAENKMKEVAELLGIEMDKPFNIKGYENNPCVLTENGFVNNRGYLLVHDVLFELLTGELEIEKPILNDVERRYLENVFRPFKYKITYVQKVTEAGYENIRYGISSPIIELFKLPYFDEGAMYKGMEHDKLYSLEELGLFDE